MSGSEFLELPEHETSCDWAKQHMQRHRDDPVVFNVSLRHDRWLQLSEHRTARGGTVTFQTDVTEIIRFERRERDKMRDQQAKILQAPLDHLNQGVCIFDNSQALVGWNSRMGRLLGAPVSRTTLGLHFSTLLEQLVDELVFINGFDAQMLWKWARARRFLMSSPCVSPKS